MKSRLIKIAIIISIALGTVVAGYALEQRGHSSHSTVKNEQSKPKSDVVVIFDEDRPPQNGDGITCRPSCGTCPPCTCNRGCFSQE